MSHEAFPDQLKNALAFLDRPDNKAHLAYLQPLTLVQVNS